MVVIAGGFVLSAAIILGVHLVSGEMEGARRGFIHGLIKCLPRQSIKIVVVVWQILTQVWSRLTVDKNHDVSSVTLLLFQRHRARVEVLTQTMHCASP